MGWIGATHDAGVTIVHFGVNGAVGVIKGIIDYMESAAKPGWKKRIDKIEQVAQQLLLEDMNRLGMLPENISNESDKKKR